MDSLSTTDISDFSKLVSTLIEFVDGTLNPVTDNSTLETLARDLSRFLRNKDISLNDILKLLGKPTLPLVASAIPQLATAFNESQITTSQTLENLKAFIALATSNTKIGRVLLKWIESI